jgi:hypothetical protein
VTAAFSRAWRRFWFEASPPEALGLCRILFFTGLFLYELPVRPSLWAGVADVFWTPIQAFRILHLPLLPASALLAAEIVWKISLAAAAIGLATRASTIIAFGLGFYLLGLQNNFGKIHHRDAAVVLALLVLAFSQCGAALSADGWIASRKRPGRVPPDLSAEFTWPARLVQVLVTFVFFSAGVSKLRHAGLEWITSDNLAIVLRQLQHSVSTRRPWLPWGVEIARHRGLCRALAAGVLATEVASPLALVSRRARFLLVPGQILLLIAIRALLGPQFLQVIFCEVFWIVPLRRSKAGGAFPAAGRE